MTPTELLDEAKANFVVLLHKDDTALGHLLKRALGKYQEKAGSTGTIKLTLEDEGSINIPGDLLDIMTAMDADTRFIESSIEDGKIVIVTEDDTEFPVTVHYFHNLREWVGNTALPAGVSSSLLLDYLVALINVPNTERERSALMAMGQQAELPSTQDLKDRILQIEEAMEESKAIGIPVAVW